MKENQSGKERKRVVVIDWENVFHDIKKRAKRGRKLDFCSFYFSFVRYLIEEKPADVYFYYSKRGNRISCWETELDNAGQRLEAIYSIFCEKRPIFLKKKWNGVLQSRVDPKIVRHVTEIISNQEEREKITDLVLVSSDNDFIHDLADLAGKYGLNMIFVTDWNPFDKRESRELVEIRYLEEIFQRNSKLFNQFDFEKIYNTRRLQKKPAFF